MLIVVRYIELNGFLADWCDNVVFVCLSVVNVQYTKNEVCH